MKMFMIFFVFALSLGSVNAAVEIKKFDSVEQETRYKYIIEELRCLVCQNQNIAGSNAGLAKDLRKKVYQMIMAGKDDDVIFDYMVTRYGDFVLYRPPFKATTFLLWLGPFIIFALGGFVLIRFIGQRKKVLVTELSMDEKETLNKLLNKDKEES